MRTARRYQPASLLAPMIDLFVLTLLVLLLRKPGFGLKGAPLPLLKEGSAAAAAPAGAAGGQTVTLRADGSARWRNEAVPLHSLAARLAREAARDGPIGLVVETDAR